MNCPMSAATIETRETADDFSLVLGGPLFQLFRRARLAGHALELMRRRIIATAAFAWVPLLILSAVEGRAWGAAVTLPFILDIDAHARFLVSLPLLISAELMVHNRMRNVVRQFLARQLIPDHARQRFAMAVDSAKRWRNSVAAELLFIVIVYAVGVMFVWRKYSALDLSSWYGLTSEGSLRLSLAGWWLRLVSVPLFQFLLFRWYFRLIIWARFLWQVSRIELNLIPTHPDRSAGLGFLSSISYAFMPLLMAQGALLAGVMANRILYGGAHLTQFKVDIFGVVLVSLIFVLAPLLVFSPQLERAKRKGRSEYGVFAQDYVRTFDQKWLRGAKPAEESLMGSIDIQSLADVGNSYALVNEMRWVPFNMKHVVQLAMVTVAPTLPLTLTMIPLDEFLTRLVKIIF
jgi:hypothetical protein